MRVLVAGSPRHLLDDPADDADSADNDLASDLDKKLKSDTKKKVDELRRAGEELGFELARKGHTILVGSDHPDDIDPYVVKGALDEGSSRIEVHVPRETDRPYANDDRITNEHIEWHQFPDWDVTTMEVIYDVDAVIVIGGRLGVVHAGTSAWMMRKPVIPIGSFKGGAEKVGRYGSSRRTEFYHHGLKDREIDRLASPWGRGVDAAFVVSAMEKVERAAARSAGGTGFLVKVCSVMGIALILWVLGLVLPFVITDWNPAWNFPLLFPTVIAAGTLGASVQTLRAVRGGTRRTGRGVFIDTALGIAAGMIAAILYLLAQIGVSAGVQVELPNEDYVRVSVIVSMAALFASLYLDAAFSRFDQVSDSVIAGKHDGL